MLDPAGPAARTIATLWWGMLAYGTCALAVVAALWWRGLHRRGPPPSGTGHPAWASKWLLVGGVLWPTFSIVALLAFGMPAGHGIQALPLPEGAPRITVDVHARRWAWLVHYAGRRTPLVNELRMPAGVPVDVRVHADDVIHSFWVPRLQGKVDAIPGRVNVLRLLADTPGVHRGQCAEFCGTGHAHMVLNVIVMPPADFARWTKEPEP